ncbi:MAG: DNA cytosine methyltransferase [Ramlibacter sp.]
MTVKAVDLFSGLGGFSQAATMAGCKVVWAANHWPQAVQVHAMNHPDTQHACQDLQQADWSQVPKMDILLASPACQGHSRARGADKPHHDVQRTTAFAVVAALEYHRPKLGLVENVPEFLQWQLYPVWKEALRTLGYAVNEQIIDAADHGVPQNRLRAFIVLSRSKKPLQVDLPRLQHKPASGVIDMRAGKWSLIDRPGRAAATLAKVAEGRRQHGRQFLIAHYGNSKGGRSLHRPIGTITTHDRYGIINGNRMRLPSKEETRALMGFPPTYKLPDNHRLAIHMLGNAVCPPPAANLIRAIIERA